jgi:hypothetical protein
MKLYELGGEYRQLERMFDDVLTDEDFGQAILDTMEGLQGVIEDKATNVVKFIKNLEAEAAEAGTEIRRLQARKASRINQVESLRVYLRDCLIATDTPKVKNALFTISVTKGRDSVVVDDARLLPQSMRTEETVYKVDKKAVKDAIDDGADVDGARIVTGDPSLSIR